MVINTAAFNFADDVSSPHAHSAACERIPWLPVRVTNATELRKGSARTEPPKHEFPATNGNAAARVLDGVLLEAALAPRGPTRLRRERDGSAVCHALRALRVRANRR